MSLFPAFFCFVQTFFGYEKFTLNTKNLALDFMTDEKLTLNTKKLALDFMTEKLALTMVNLPSLKGDTQLSCRQTSL